MDSKPILHLSPAKEMKCSFLYYVQLLMISQACRWTWTPSTTPLQPKKWNAHFSLRSTSDVGQTGQWTQTPSTTPLQPQKWNAHFSLRSTSDVGQTGQWTQTPSTTPLQPKIMKCSFLDYIQLLMIGQAGWWTQTPSTTRLQPKKWNPHFCIKLNFWWSARLVDGLEPHLPPFSSQNNVMLIFGLHSTSDDWPSWLMDSNLIQHPSPANKMKCSFLDCVHFWWSAGLVDELEPHLPLLSYQKNEMLIFGLCSTSDDQPGCSMDSNPICHPSPAKKWNAHFWIIFNFWWLAGLVEGLKPHPPPLSTPKNEMLIFGLCSTSDDWPGWSMDSNPIHHPSPPKNMKCLFLYNIQHLMLARLVNGHKPHLPPLFSQKNEMLLFWITLNFWWLAGLVNGLKPHLPPLSSQKMKCSFLDYVQLLMTGRAGQWTWKKMKCLLLDYVHFWWSAWLIDELEPHLPTLYYQKNEMLNFRLRSTFDDQPSWSMDSNPICHPSPTKKMKCFFFGLHSTSDDWPGWVMDSNPINHPSPAKKMKCSILDYIQLLKIGRAGWWTQTPSTTHLQQIKWNPHFCITLNFWWSTGLVDGLEPHLPTLSSQ